jgi:hypothetical protein
MNNLAAQTSSCANPTLIQSIAPLTNNFDEYIEAKPKHRRLQSAVPGGRRPLRIPEEIADRKVKVPPAAKYSKPSYEIHNTSVNSRKDIWDKQLSTKKLQEEAHLTLSNYEITNRQIKE